MINSTIFNQPDTLCQREGNRCKLKKKCLRYLKTQGDMDWVADYWTEFGMFCDYFIAAKEPVDVPKANKDKG